MADEPLSVRGINWRETLPFTHIFRSFRIAIHPSKLILALAAVILLYLGGRFLDWVWPERYSATPEERAVLYNTGYGSLNRAIDRSFSSGTDGPFITFLRYEVQQMNNMGLSVIQLNIIGALASAADLLVTGPMWLLKNHPLLAAIWLIWFMVIWSVFGGAIARIAAVHVARDEKMSVRSALRFSISKVLSFAFAPIIPLLIVLATAVVVAVVGWILLHIPWIGPILVGALLFLALGAGFVMTLVLLGTIGGLNMMFPTVAVEGSDSFDAISRSFSYVYARPWRLLFYSLVALIYGAITYMFIRLFIFLVLLLTNNSIGWFLSGQTGAYWNYGNEIVRTVDDQQITERPARDYDHDTLGVIWPTPRFDHLPYNVYFGGLKWSEKIAAGLTMAWVYLVISILGAFAISFYFSASTIIYYLMRREVDATEMDDVYVEEPEEEFTETPPGSADAGASGTETQAAPPPDAPAPTADKPQDTPPAADAPSSQGQEQRPEDNSPPAQ